MTDKELLRIDNISVNYGNIKALRGVSMNVNEGEIVALIGANGAGKSTLLKAIVGQEPLVEGSISYDGQMLYAVKDKHYHGVPTYNVVKNGIALVPEGRVFGELGVIEGKPRTMTSVAGEETIVTVVDKESFPSFIKEHPNKLLVVMESLSSRIRNQSQKLVKACKVVASYAEEKETKGEVDDALMGQMKALAAENKRSTHNQ